MWSNTLGLSGYGQLLFLQLPMQIGMIVLAVVCAKKYCPGKSVAEALDLKKTEAFSYGKTIVRFFELLILIAVLNCLVYVIDQWLGLKLPEQSLVLAAQQGSPAVFIAIMIPAVFLAPISEELLFRGALYRFFNSILSGWEATVLSALIFAAIHWNLRFFLPLFAMGLVLQAAYKESGSLRSCILIHMLNNLSTALLVMGYRALGKLF